MNQDRGYQLRRTQIFIAELSSGEVKTLPEGSIGMSEDFEIAFLTEGNGEPVLDENRRLTFRDLNELLNQHNIEIPQKEVYIY